MIRSLLRRLLLQAGYRVSRVALETVPDDPDSRVAATLPASECYGVFRTACPIFQPWMGYGEFAGAMEGVPARTLVSADRCHMVWRFARHARRLPGDFVECGVFRGGTALLLARTLSGTGPDRTLHLFDSFEGLAASSGKDGDFYPKGAFSETSEESVRELLAAHAPHVRLHRGWIPNTFSGLDSLRIAFAHIDVDQYQAALDCLLFLYPRLVPGGIMVFDDYGFPACRGERKAVDEFFAGDLAEVIPLPTGQALVIKPAAPINSR